MAKRQSFADKSSKVSHTQTCPVCNQTIQFIKHMRGVKGDRGQWKMRPVTVGVCKCNEQQVYG